MENLIIEDSLLAEFANEIYKDIERYINENKTPNLKE